MAIQVTADGARFLPTLDDWAAVIPAERFLRRDRSLTFQRNATVYATDGRVGVLRKVIVDEAAGEVKGLVIELEANGATILMPVDLVEKTGGAAIFLNLKASEFLQGASAAPVYEKHRFTKVNVRALRKNGARAAEQRRREAITRLRTDLVETATVTKFDLV